mgnify:CR=1 FL=1
MTGTARIKLYKGNASLVGNDAFDIVDRPFAAPPTGGRLVGYLSLAVIAGLLVHLALNVHTTTGLRLGTGLLFARERLDRPHFTAADADFVGRNLAKARLALGDAVLAVSLGRLRGLEQVKLFGLAAP